MKIKNLSATASLFSLATLIISMSGVSGEAQVKAKITQQWPAKPAEAPQESRLWKDFEKATPKDPAPILPDFSYAGYHQGKDRIQPAGKIFSVIDYGAKPDDMLDDADGIQKAIDAAEANGGGIVFLPRGRYLVNTSMSKRKSIEVRASSIVIRGEGAGKGGTIIHQIHPFESSVPPSDNRHYHLGSCVFNIHALGEETPFSEKKDLCRVAGRTDGDAFSITVDNAADLAAGMNVFLYARSTAAILEMLRPREYNSEWSNIQNNPHNGELHTVAGVNGNTVTFSEPVRYPLRGADGWVLKPFKPLTEVGVEDICFMGNAYARYVHHRNDLEDSGWAFIKVKGTKDSWIRRVSFINASQTISFTLSMDSSILNVITLGNKGHHIPRIGWFSSNVLGGLIDDRASFTHGPSISQGVVGTVYWRCTIAPAEPIDSHAGRPFCSLYDHIKGGSLLGSTGGIRDFPQHMRKLVIWNFSHGVPADEAKPLVYDFWDNKNKGVFIDPIISGFHGEKALFNEDTLEALESLGTPVNPESLYEAQLERRLGKAPEWIAEARADHAAMTSAQYPEYFDRHNNVSRPLLYPETFRVDEMLKFVTARAMRMFGKEFFTCNQQNQSLTVTADQCLVRNAIYAGMAAVYSYSKNGNTITVTEKRRDGRSIIHFVISSGKPVSTADAPEDSEDFRDLSAYVGILGGRASISDMSGIAVEIEIPWK